MFYCQNCGNKLEGSLTCSVCGVTTDRETYKKLLQHRMMSNTKTIEPTPYDFPRAIVGVLSIPIGGLVIAMSEIFTNPGFMNGMYISFFFWLFIASGLASFFSCFTTKAFGPRIAYICYFITTAVAIKISGGLYYFLGGVTATMGVINFASALATYKLFSSKTGKKILDCILIAAIAIVVVIFGMEIFNELNIINI